jgi:hypothetical protein
MKAKHAPAQRKEPHVAAQRAARKILKHCGHLYREGSEADVIESEFLSKIISAEYQPLVDALQQFADCNLNESNCASFDVANRRIRRIANLALEQLTPSPGPESGK